MTELDDSAELEVLPTPPQRPRNRVPTVEAYQQERERIEDADVIQALRSIDGADSVRWRIERVNSEDPERNGHVMECGTDSIDAEILARKLGPGKYKIVGRYQDGSYAAARRLTIASDAIQVTRGQGTSSTSSGTSLDELEARYEARRARERAERNELLKIMVPALAPIGAAFITGMVGNRGPDVAALVAALKPPPAPTMPEMMTALASLKSLAPEQTTDPIDRALKLLDVIQDKAPSGGETGWLDVVKEVIRAAGPTVGTVIEGAVQSAMTRASPTSTTPAAAPSGLLPAPSAAPGGSVSATPQENPQMLGLLALIPWLKQQLEMAIQKASRGSDPVLIAERILDDLPDSADPEQLLAFVQREDWWAQLQRLDARVLPYAQWFARMRQAMLEQFGQEIAVTSGEAPPPVMTVSEVKSETIERPAGPPSLTGK